MVGFALGLLLDFAFIGGIIMFAVWAAGFANRKIEEARTPEPVVSGLYACWTDNPFETGDTVRVVGVRTSRDGTVYVQYVYLDKHGADMDLKFSSKWQDFARRYTLVDECRG